MRHVLSYASGVELLRLWVAFSFHHFVVLRVLSVQNFIAQSF